MTSGVIYLRRRKASQFRSNNIADCRVRVRAGKGQNRRYALSKTVVRRLVQSISVWIISISQSYRMCTTTLIWKKYYIPHPKSRIISLVRCSEQVVFINV